MASGDDDDIPIERVYEEGVAPVNPVDLLFQEQQGQWSTVEFSEITVTGRVREALADAAMQFHYIYLSHLIVLGDIIMNAESVEVKRLASFLAASRIRDVDAWGRYLAMLEMQAAVNDPVHTYCTLLYQDATRLSRLMGIVLADVFRQSVGQNATDFPDPTFGRLMARDLEEGDHNVELTRDYLQRINTALTPEEREEVVLQMERYGLVIDNILDANADALSHLNADLSAIRDQVHADIASFHDIIDQG